MNRILLWTLSTITVLVLLFGYRTSTSGPSEVSAASALPAISGSGSQSTSTTTPDPTTPDTTAPRPTAPKPQKRTITGPVAQTAWGPVQVEITIRSTDGTGGSGGTTISDVSVVQYPSGNGTDQQINSYALPILIRETLDQQSARIDMVSGATITSQGYLTSLQAAIDQATA